MMNGYSLAKVQYFKINRGKHLEVRLIGIIFAPYIYFTLIEFYPTLRLTVLNRMDSSKKLHINNKYDRINLKV